MDSNVEIDADFEMDTGAFATDDPDNLYNPYDPYDPFSCYSERPAGGCGDTVCEKRVCAIQPLCCDNSIISGEWDSTCVGIATAICRPRVVPRLPGPCPLGFICDDVKMSNCSDIRETARDLYRVGDVYGGIYCPEGNDEMINCPPGYFCPDPVTMELCPSEKFCPHKTVVPEIVCINCEEGATELERDLYGFIVLGILGGLFVLLVALHIMKRYKKELVDRLYDLQARQVDRVRVFMHRTERREQLERIRPKLELISRRLKALDDGSETELSEAAMLTEEEVKFDARRLFDAMDKDGNGELDYEELNAILGLDETELRHFVLRMNQLAGAPSIVTCVGRRTFCTYFLQVLQDTSNFKPSDEEAADLYEEILNCGGDDDGELTAEKFYQSTLSHFLSDAQIHELIRKFATLKQGEVARKSRTGQKSILARKAIRSLSVRRSAYASISRVTQAEFVRHYHDFLQDVTVNFQPTTRWSVHSSQNGEDVENAKQDVGGIDICFKSLSLVVKVADKEFSIVDSVTGRVRAKTMTALMGGSGAGKTSLLNALCGRAFYGEVTGKIYVNGNLTSIEEIKDSVGFVPQDDIVYAELTVRENFIYSGKFRLPKGTPDEAIEELADATLANLGLSRVANSLVGDVKRRGVSGGEKKRVNIGLELMANPSVLFLDEPTSGLDASSALLVMQSMKRLVEVEGVTIVSVIHQPRKFIFDLFDSLILLGVGGHMVYHGPIPEAKTYFNALNYTLPEGENVADWFIDISSGRIEPDSQIARSKNEESAEDELDDRDRQKKKRKKKKHKKKKRSNDESNEQDPEVQTDEETDILIGAAKDVDAVGTKGVTTGKVAEAFEEAKARRAWLYQEWETHFDNLSRSDREIYKVPEKYDLPKRTVKPMFFLQLYYQVTRGLLVAWRNAFSKFLDTFVIVGAVVVICALSGIAEATRNNQDPDIPFETVVRPEPEDLPIILRQLFKYAFVRQIEFPLKVGIILAVLIGLTATKIFTEKRLEFFREAASGVDINAYFLSINCIATFEHSIQAAIAAFFAAWLRNPISSVVGFYVHFLLLTWICVSWALLLPVIVPPENVTVVVGFCMAFFGLLFSGALPPAEYKTIYEDRFLEFFSGWVSPTRFFNEALAVSEYRCLPPQSGFTLPPEEEQTVLPRSYTTMALAGLAGHDPSAVEQSCNGWYWSVLPVIFIGLTMRFAACGALHVFNRDKQTKKPLVAMMMANMRVACTVISYCIALLGLFALTTWLMMRDVGVVFDEREQFAAEFSSYFGTSN